MEASDIQQKVYKDLNEVIDPELGIGIVDLGLIYDVKVSEDYSKISIDMTLTTPNCPMSGYLPEMAGEKVRVEFPGQSVDVRVVWEPQWTPDKITENGRKFLGME